MTMINNNPKPQETAVITNSQLTLKSNTNNVRKFTSFRRNSSADINVAEIKVESRVVIKQDGTQLDPDVQYDILASYLTSQVPVQVDRITASIKKFMSDPNIVIDERINSSSDDPNTKAKEWLKTSLYHAICGIPDQFRHNNESYRVIKSSEEFKLTGLQVLSFLSGESSLNLQQNGSYEETLEPSNDLEVIINLEVLSDAMRQIISELDIDIKDGQLSIFNVVVKSWKSYDSINIKHSSSSLSQLDLGI